MTVRLESPVLIIGGGPVGLSCAIELAWRGIDSLLVEKGDGVVRYSKMGGVAIRTMEFCRRWGMADRVRGCGFPEDYPLNQVVTMHNNSISLQRRPVGAGSARKAA